MVFFSSFHLLRCLIKIIVDSLELYKLKETREELPRSERKKRMTIGQLRRCCFFDVFFSFFFFFSTSSFSFLRVFPTPKTKLRPPASSYR